VVAGLQDDEVIAPNGADQPVLLVDPTRPAAGQVATQPFGLPGARPRTASVINRLIRSSTFRSPAQLVQSSHPCVVKTTLT